jgi:aminopeptidase N
MSIFQTLLALVVLIFVLSVIVQAVQEVLKSLANTKANTMEETIDKFMGDRLPLSQVQAALQTRGLDITALEHFNKDDFRHLLDGIQLALPQVQGLVASATATVEQAKDNIAAAYEGARVAFQKSYTTTNKKWAIGLSFLVVLALNASLIRMYEILAANQNLSQAISGTASTIINTQRSAQNAASSSQAPSLPEIYEANRKTITEDLQKYPILLRTSQYPEDFRQEALNEIVGLLLMGILVSLGAPFWNDVLKSMMGVNNVLNMNGKRAA